MVITQQPPKLEKKISADLESSEFQKFFVVCLTKLKNFQFYLIKLATDFYYWVKYSYYSTHTFLGYPEQSNHRHLQIDWLNNGRHYLPCFSSQYCQWPLPWKRQRQQPPHNKLKQYIFLQISMSATQMGLFLFLLHCPMWPRQEGICNCNAKLQMFLPKNFVNENKK